MSPPPRNTGPPKNLAMDRSREQAARMREEQRRVSAMESQRRSQEQAARSRNEKSRSEFASSTKRFQEQAKRDHEAARRASEMGLKQMRDQQRMNEHSFQGHGPRADEYSQGEQGTISKIVSYIFLFIVLCFILWVFYNIIINFYYFGF